MLTRFNNEKHVSDKYWDKGTCPLLFYTGNEGDIVSFWVNTGFVFELAQKLHGLILFGEHVRNLLITFLKLKKIMCEWIWFEYVKSSQLLLRVKFMFILFDITLDIFVLFFFVVFKEFFIGTLMSNKSAFFL